MLGCFNPILGQIWTTQTLGSNNPAFFRVYIINYLNYSSYCC